MSRIEAIEKPSDDEETARSLERLAFMMRNGKVKSIALIALDPEGGLLQITTNVKGFAIPLIGAIELMKRDVMGICPQACPCEFDSEFHEIT